MKRRYRKCVICGKKRGTHELKLPFGNVPICSNYLCREKLNFKVNDSVPIVWFVPEDLTEHTKIHPDALKLLKNENTLRETAGEVADYIWGGDILGETFHEALNLAAKQLEYDYIKTMNDKYLPLIQIEDLGYKESQDLLEQRLKGGT